MFADIRYFSMLCSSIAGFLMFLACDIESSIILSYHHLAILWGMIAMISGILQFILLRLLVIFGLLCLYNMGTVAETNRAAGNPQSLNMPRYQEIRFPNVETSDRSVGAQALAID